MNAVPWSTHRAPIARIAIRSSIFALIIACQSDSGTAAKPAATVTNAPKESELASVTLSEDAERRLGIRVEPVERRRVPRVRTFGAEVSVPPGLAITVAAPVAGTVLVPSTGRSPAPGMRVRSGDELLRLATLPPESDLVRGEEDVAVADVRLRTAKAKAERYTKLYSEQAVTAQEYEDVQAELASAEAAARAARLRAGVMTSGYGGAAVPALPITAPESGVIDAVHVAPGQTVAAAAPLFEVVRLDRVWIRVPVYVGDAREIARGVPARITEIGAPESAARAARPIAAPPSADPDAASVDLYYEMANADGYLRPGERVGATLTLTGDDGEQLTVRWSAVLHDAFGGTWVYARTAPRVYSRQRVSVRSVVGEFAVLAAGPEPGTGVVTIGAAELFGTEFGTGK